MYPLKQCAYYSKDPPKFKLQFCNEKALDRLRASVIKSARLNENDSHLTWVAYATFLLTIRQGCALITP